MEHIRFVVLTQDGALSEQAVQERVMRCLPGADIAPDVTVLHCTQADRMQKLNAHLDNDLANTDRVLVIDADRLPLDTLQARMQNSRERTEDVFCCCSPAPKQASFNAHRNRYVQYLCEQTVFWLFSEKAVRRMCTADTTDLIEETLTDSAITVRIESKDCMHRNAGIRLLRCYVDARRLLLACAVVSLTAAAAFLILLLCQWSAFRLIGCIVCAHLVLISLAALLIRWYTRSAKQEPKKREHPYVEESYTK